MDTELFWERLVRALAASGFRFAARDFNGEGVTSDGSVLEASVRLFAKFGPGIFSVATGIGLPDGFGEIHPLFNQEGVQKSLDGIRQFAQLVCFKYMLAQPIIVAAVPGDHQSDAELLAKAKAFDDAILGMREFTGKMSKTRLSVTGVMLWVFFESGQAAAFHGRMQKQCKIWHFWEKTWVVPWAIDVPGRQLQPHDGIPILVPQILSSKKLAQDIFNA
jgi:hypothetical protein